MLGDGLGDWAGLSFGDAEVRAGGRAREVGWEEHAATRLLPTTMIKAAAKTLRGGVTSVAILVPGEGGRILDRACRLE